MHTLTTARVEPYVWATWIAKLLAGESCCIWSAWVRAHFQTARVATDFDLGSWQMDHSALLRRTVSEYENNGFRVFVEGQNHFCLRGKAGTLSGKPDVVAVNEAVGWIIDAKTGAPKASDRIQVMVYMWALPKTNPAFAGVSFTGKVIYKCGYNLVIPDEIDREFGQRVVELLKEVCGDVEPYKAPSFSECQYCPVTRSDCVDRVEKAETHRGETDEF